MWTSTDNGVSFSNVKRVTDASSGGCADGPKVAWDPTNHKAWITWWNAGQSYLRSVSVAANGTMMLGSTINLSTLTQGLALPSPQHMAIPIKPAIQQGK